MLFVSGVADEVVEVGCGGGVGLEPALGFSQYEDPFDFEPFAATLGAGDAFMELVGTLSTILTASPTDL